MSRGMVVTIDGAAGTGKSTAARQLAEVLGWQFLDTGAMYRAAALAMLEAGEDPADPKVAAKRVQSIQVDFDWSASPPEIQLDGRGVGHRIRDLDVSAAASAIAIHPPVRDRLKQLQRDVAASCEGLVSEGRDQGSVVFPDALVRFFLTAPVEIRAERRIRQLEAQGKFADAQAVRQDLEDRDQRDQSREEAPLVRAPGSVDIDTGRLDQAAVVHRMVQAVEDARDPGSSEPLASRRINPAPGMHPLRRFIVWKCLRGVVELWGRLWHGLRMWNRNALPPEGPLIYIMNHQSLLDPPLVGVLVRRRPCAFLARKGLFAFKPFGALIRFMCAIPLDIARGGGRALRAAIRELEAGRCVLIFPEGQRTNDGRMGRFRGGVLLLARKTNASVVPLAIDGAWDAWSRHQKWPRLGAAIGMRIGEPISAEVLGAMEEVEALEHLKREVEKLRLEVRGDLRRATRGAWPRPGLGDVPYWAEEEADPAENPPQADARD
jgi:cytidylate kinase